MRKSLGALVLVMALRGVAGAQDAGAAAAMAAQQSMQMAQQASQQAIDSMNQASQLAQQSMQMAMLNNSHSMPAPRPPLPMTPMPLITPGGGRFTGSVQVVIADADPRAIVFYTTDGSTPTLRSQRYVGPIVVSEKTRVRALAFDLDRMPSGIVVKTFKVTS